MTEMNGNCQCYRCGVRGERGLDVVIYRIDGQACPVCEDCAVIAEDVGQVLERLADQSGEAA